MCYLAKQRGLTTIGISSIEHSRANTPKNILGKRLCEVADISIDNHTPEGDALIPLSERIRFGGGSTVSHMMIMNTIVVETASILFHQEVPVHLYPSHNVSEDVEGQLDTVFNAYKKLLAKL